MFGKACLLFCLPVMMCCCQGREAVGPPAEGERKMGIKVTSTAFEEGAPIPAAYTADGLDVSPPLKFGGVPEETKSIALICDDPDAPAGTWVHWVLYNLPPDVKMLSDNIPAAEILENGARHGVNDSGNFGYGGPAPPGGTHRYYFKVYCLDTMLDLSGKVTKKQLLDAMKGHVLAEGQVMGTYSR